jgi:tetratricopeptide (TPR) repeat protein
MSRSIMYFRPVRPLSSLLPYLLLAAIGSALAFGQESKPVPEVKAAPSEKGTAYYDFAMGHLYSEMASAYGNRGEFLNKAIDFYKEALKLDPTATFLSEELTELYIQSGQLNRAVTEAEDLIKQNPDNLDARRVLARIYIKLIGDPQTGKTDENMLRKSIEQFKVIVEKDKNDQESRLILARLYNWAHDSVNAENTYKSILEVEPDNEEALTGLANVYAAVGDTKGAIEMLKRASDKDPNLRSLGALAGFYHDMKDYRAAAETYKRMIPLAPDNGKLKRQYALDLLFSDQVDEAVKLYNEIAAEDPKDADVQLKLSKIYQEKHDFAAAHAAFNKARQIDPKNIDVRYDEVDLLFAEGKTPAAIVVLKGILDDKTLDPAAAATLNERLGILYRANNQFPDAITAFRQTAVLDPDQASHISIQIIETYRMAHNLPEARKEADAAIKKSPKDRLVVIEHASVLSDQGKTTEAVNELKSLMGSAGDRDTLLVMAGFYEKAKKYTEEAKSLDDAEALSTSKQEKQGIQFARGAMFDKEKNYDAAEKEFRKILAGDPDNAGALNYIGYMLADRDVRLEEAQKLIQRAVALDPENYAYLDSLGWVYYRQNMFDQAESQLLKALEKMDSDPTIHDHLGDIYAKEGKIREAIAQWQTSVKEYETNPPSDSDPGDLAKVTRKLESARVRVAKEGK